MRRAKIIATLGPASQDVETITQLIEAGVNVTRVNMSHGTHESHENLIKNIRKASQSLGKEVAILIDLQGPKIRVDKLDENLVLKKGEKWVIGPTKKKEKYPQYKDHYIPTIYEALVDDCFDGARILFDDGNLVAKAIKREGDVYQIEILVGGELKSNKGINLPDCEVSAPSFTEKDQQDLMFALKQNIDYIALSFVRKKEDVLNVKFLLHELKMNIPIVAKIEKPQAIDNLDGILEATDVIMVARGDMGVEVGNHLVPSLQKQIINRCNQARVPVITATQMLESMTENPTPTRAEASDVANAVWDGTDAVMLSGESASGKYPIEAVKTMNDIILEAEKTPKERPFLRNLDLSAISASVMVAASMIAEKVKAVRILSFTESGSSCRRISIFRPHTPVVGITNSQKTARRLCLYWGVNPFLVTEVDQDSLDFQKQVLVKIRQSLQLQNGDKLVITRGDGKFFSKGSSNSVRVEIIKDAPKVLGSSEGLEEAEDDKKRILLDTSMCASCQSCVQVCPHEIWQVSTDESHKTYINQSQIKNCSLDMACVDACPTGAIEILSTFGQ